MTTMPRVTNTSSNGVNHNVRSPGNDDHLTTDRKSVLTHVKANFESKDGFTVGGSRLSSKVDAREAELAKHGIAKDSATNDALNHVIAGYKGGFVNADDVHVHLVKVPGQHGKHEVNALVVHAESKAFEHIAVLEAKSGTELFRGTYDAKKSGFSYEHA